jgi:hypothetical protein
VANSGLVEAQEVLADRLVRAQAPEVLADVVPELDAHLCVHRHDTSAKPGEDRLEQQVQSTSLLGSLLQVDVGDLELVAPPGR